MSQKQYRFVTVEDPTTGRVLLVDTDYGDGPRPVGKHRVVAVDAEPLNTALNPTIRASLRQIDEICDRLNEVYFPTCKILSAEERLLASDKELLAENEKLWQAQLESETG